MGYNEGVQGEASVLPTAIQTHDFLKDFQKSWKETHVPHIISVEIN